MNLEASHLAGICKIENKYDFVYIKFLILGRKIGLRPKNRPTAENIGLPAHR